MSLTKNTSRALGALMITFTLAAGTGCNGASPEISTECAGQEMRYMGLVEDPDTQETFAVVRNTSQGCGPSGVIILNRDTAPELLNGAGHKAGMKAIKALENHEPDTQTVSSGPALTPEMN